MGLSSSNLGSVPLDRSTVIVLMPTSYKWFEEWQEEPKGKRSSDYEALKASFVEAALLAVMKVFPQLEGKVGGACGDSDRTPGAIPPFSLGQETKTMKHLTPEKAGTPCRPSAHWRAEGEEMRISPSFTPALWLPFFPSSGGQCECRNPADQSVLSGCSLGCHLWG